MEDNISSEDIGGVNSNNHQSSLYKIEIDNKLIGIEELEVFAKTNYKYFLEVVNIIYRTNINFYTELVFPLVQKYEEGKEDIKKSPNSPSYKKDGLKIIKKAFSFEGRIRRSEYFISWLIPSIILLIVYALDSLFRDIRIGAVIGVVLILFTLILSSWFLLAQRIKRCHDIGLSGWYQLIPYFDIMLVFVDSNYGINIFGPNPKGIGNDDTHYNRGFTSSKSKNYEEELAAFTMAIQMKPDDAKAYNNISFWYLDMKKYDDAEINFKKCLDLEDNNIDATIGLSILYYRKQCYAESKLWMNKALDLENILKEDFKGLTANERVRMNYSAANRSTVNEIFWAMGANRRC